MPRRRLIKNFTRVFKQLCRHTFCQPWFPLLGRTFSEKENTNLSSLPEVNYREQLLHILGIQRAINNLNFHIDWLVSKGVVFSPCFIKFYTFSKHFHAAKQLHLRLLLL